MFRAGGLVTGCMCNRIDSSRRRVQSCPIGRNDHRPCVLKVFASVAGTSDFPATHGHGWQNRPVPAVNPTFLTFITDAASGAMTLTPIVDVGQIHVIGAGSFTSATVDSTLTGIADICDDTAGFGLCHAH